GERDGEHRRGPGQRGGYPGGSPDRQRAQPGGHRHQAGRADKRSAGPQQLCTARPGPGGKAQGGQPPPQRPGAQDRTTGMRKENAMNSSIGTIARSACRALALTNQLLSAAGKPVLPSEDSQLEALITSGLTVAAALAAWRKNNSFTSAAIRADAALKAARRP